MSTEGLELLRYVLAGLIASSVFYGLTNYKRPSPFERVVQALVYTAIVQLAAEFIAGVAGVPELASSLAFVLLLSAALGFILAVAANNGLPHKWLVNVQGRNWKITSKTVYGSNLSHAFETRREYVALTLKNGRRVYGWPELWPDHPDEDHFLLLDYEWLPRADGGPAAADEKKSSQGAILIAAKDVDVVEFVPNKETTPLKDTTP